MIMTRCFLEPGYAEPATDTLEDGSAFMNLNYYSGIYKKTNMPLPNEFAKWTICDPVPSKSGGRTCAILGAKTEPIVFTLPPLKSPFDALGCNDPDAERVNISLEIGPENEEIVTWVKELDSQIIKLCKQNSNKLFPGKDIYLESDLKPMYFSPLKTNEKYGTHLFKCKLNKRTGRHACRVWNKSGLARESPESWQGLTVQCRVVLKSLWLQSRTFGLTFEVVDAMVAEDQVSHECPFANGYEF